MTSRTHYLSMREATARLEIKPQTLYAYVSRGWIRSVSQANSRGRLYLREDVEKVRMRSLARAGHGPAAAAAMQWGEPVIQSSITDITPQGPRYRGRLAVDLAHGGQTFESVAGLLWTGILNEAPVAWSPPAPPRAYYDAIDQVVHLFSDAPFRQVMAIAVQTMSAVQRGDPEKELGSTEIAARQMLQASASAFGYLRTGRFAKFLTETPIAEAIARALGANAKRDTLRLLNAALILSADHELAPATFVARIAASTGAAIYGCMVSAIAPFDGPLTGLGADRTEDLVRSAGSVAELRKYLRSLKDQRRSVPGFNHPAYSGSDPRALALLEAVQQLGRLPTAAKNLIDIARTAPDELDLYPALPVGLVATCLALQLPRRSAGGLFLLGRMAGWIAHVQEQRLAGFLLRPRAKYAATA